MRLAVISDIHGNNQALEAVLEDIDTQRVDAVISLGDNVGYGPQPEQVVKTLAERNIDSVMGNHEFALISASYFSRLNPPTRDSLEITKSLLSQASINWLSTLPPTLEKYGGRFVHGCPPYSMTTYLFNPSRSKLLRIFQNYTETFAFSGHTHMLEIFSTDRAGNVFKEKLTTGQTHLEKGRRYLVIPGSVGQPRDTLNNMAKYGIWDKNGTTIEIRAVAYDVEKTMKLITDKGFPVNNARRLKW